MSLHFHSATEGNMFDIIELEYNIFFIFESLFEKMIKFTFVDTLINCLFKI